MIGGGQRQSAYLLQLLEVVECLRQFGVTKVIHRLPLEEGVRQCHG